MTVTVDPHPSISSHTEGRLHFVFGLKSDSPDIGVTVLGVSVDTYGSIDASHAEALAKLHAWATELADATAGAAPAPKRRGFFS